MVLACFRQTLVLPADVVSSLRGDVFHQFLFTRAFGFGEMAKGNLPLWNPYLFSGVPFLGDFQSALLYPLNWSFLLLPDALAINWSFALHVWILGAGTYFWSAGRGLGKPAAVLAAVAGMFALPFFLHVHAGHLSNVCSMAWAPWVFACIDRYLISHKARWVTLASVAVAMQVYAGHPQYAYYTALVAGIYSLLHLPLSQRPFWKSALGLLAIYPLAGALAAAQIFPGLEAVRESVRAAGTPYEFAASFSFPPEHFITVLAPWFFGELAQETYWGRLLLWELDLYGGLGVLTLAVLALGGAKRRGGQLLLLCAGCSLLLALGQHIPLHRVLYEILPGYDAFRGSSKFIFFAALFLSLMAGMGFERLLRRDAIPVLCVFFPLGLSIAALAGSLALSQTHSTGLLNTAIEFIVSTGENYYDPILFTLPQNLQSACSQAAQSLRLAALLAALLSLLLIAARYFRPAAWGLSTFACLEIFLFAASTVTTFPLRAAALGPVAEEMKKIPGDFRILNLFHPNSVIALRREGIWGQEPSVLARYAKLMRASQRYPLDAIGNDAFGFNHPHPVLDLFRAGYLLDWKNGSARISSIGNPFPRLFLVADYKVMDKSEILEELREPFVDLRKVVLLESEPHPKPDGLLSRGRVRILQASTDHYLLEIETDAPSILVIGDSYSDGWRVAGRPGNAQVQYNVMPANYACRAIPLASGSHYIRLEYLPPSFPIGVLVTLTSIGLLGIIAWGLKGTKSTS